MNIAVFMGGISPERNVSLNSGKAVANALREAGHTVTMHDPAKGASCRIDNDIHVPSVPPSEAELASYSVGSYLECVNSGCTDSADVIFSVLHGKYGEDGIMQALLEARGKKYTGSTVMSSALAMDKHQSKIAFVATGIPTPHWKIIRSSDELDHALMQEIRSEVGNDLVVKPNDQGSTVGMTIIRGGHLDDISDAIRTALRYSSTALVETFIPGRELTVAVLGSEALPIIEIAPDGGFYDYEHKYTKGMSQYICPAELDENLTDFIQQLAITAHRSLQCRAYSRVDFRLDDDNQPWCLEVNTLPGMTETSLVPKAAAANGMSFTELCEAIITHSNPDNE
ncbi:MAG: D-alanine--D-alanine ligase [Candidatus Kapabacteria bacterium]|nr:D-alanine--D-alanine ligase [Candidatus Kapabacteria bacterium]